MKYPQKTYDFVVRLINQVKKLHPRIHTGTEDNILVDFDNSLIYKLVKGQKIPISYDELDAKIVTVFNIIGHTIAINNSKNNSKASLKPIQPLQINTRKSIGIRKTDPGINVAVIHLVENIE